MTAARNLHIKYILVIVVITAITVLSVVALFNRTDRMFKAENALASTQSQLTDTLTELSTTTSELATTKQILSQTQAELTVTQEDLSETQDDLSKTQDALQTMSDNLADTSEELTNTEADLVTASEQLAVKSELADTLRSDMDNLQSNYDALTIGYGYVVKDPTYRDMKSFLAADTTDSFAYTTNEFVCHDFAAVVAGNAREQKIRCAYVMIDFIDDGTPGHAIIAFNTTDRGLIYVEPQSDEQVNLRIGYSYWLSIVPKPGYYYDKPDYDDTVEDILALW